MRSRKAAHEGVFALVNAPDVLVLGSGVAGTAAAVHLSRAGMRVLCVAPGPEEETAVGESLD